LLGFYGLLELGLRLGGFEYASMQAPISIWNPAEDQALIQGRSLHQFDRQSLWSPRPLASVPWSPEEQVSAGGVRGADRRPDAELVVAALGDSSTFGWGVTGDATWPALLEAELAPGRQVLNAGVIGFSVRQGLERLRAHAPSWRPDVVVAAFGAVNEHFLAKDYDDRGKLRELARRQGQAALAARWLRTELRVSHLVAWAGDALKGGRESLMADELERLRSQDELSGEYLEHQDYPRRVSVADFELALDELAADCDARGAQLVLVAMPRRLGVEERYWPLPEYDAALERSAERLGLPIADARAAFEAERGLGASEDELFQDSFHPTARGQALIASTVRGALGDAILGRP